VIADPAREGDAAPVISTFDAGLLVALCVGVDSPAVFVRAES
jgi:hypothetical protein